MDKLSKSASGKLGQAASLAKQQIRKAERRGQYEASPKLCLQCSDPIAYDKRSNRFCGSSCSATFNNTGKKRATEKNCLSCGTLFRKKANIYCSHACSSVARSFDFAAWKRGELVGHTGSALQVKRGLRLHLLREANYACSLCGWSERHPEDGQPLVEVDHIDGDANNTTPNNLRVLCPNCHSMTPTFRARNRRSSRLR